MINQCITFQDRPVPLAPKPLDIINTLKPYNDIELHK